MVSRVTKIEREKERNWAPKEEGEEGTSRREGARAGEKRDGSDALGSVAGGEDGPPSRSSLVTMNGPNESRGPIKDYSRRRSAGPTSTCRRCEKREVPRRWSKRRCLHACLTYAGACT